MTFLDFLNEDMFFYPDKMVDSAWTAHIPFAFWLISVHKPKVFVELGTYSGNSYLSFCQAVKKNNLNTRCYAVDSWKGDKHCGYYDEEIFVKLSQYNAEHYSHFSHLIHSTFDEALNFFSDGAIDLLHIDGFHTYETVKHDFETWLPKLSSKAIVIFHDTNVKVGDFGVFRFWEELSPKYPHFEFLHGFGLGILGVGRESSEIIKRLFSATKDQMLADRIRELYSYLGIGIVNKFALQTLQNRFNVILSELVALKGQINDKLSELEYEKNKVDQLEKKILAIYKTISWKITYPLRLMSKNFPRLANIVNKMLFRNAIIKTLHFVFMRLKKYLQKLIECIWIYCLNHEVDKLLSYVQKLNNKGDFTLILDHNLGGGANFYIDEWIKDQRKTKNILLLRYLPVIDFYSLTLYVDERSQKYHLSPLHKLWKLFDKISIDEILINSLVSYKNSLKILHDIANLKHQYKFKITVFVHSFHFVCPNFTLFDGKGKHCGLPDYETCGHCITKVKLANLSWEHKILFANDFSNLLQWRVRWNVFLNKYVDTIICFSRSSKEILIKAHANISESKIFIFPHVVRNIVPIEYVLSDDEIRIGVLGNIFHEMKGANVIYHMAKLISEKKYENVKLIVIGTLNERYHHKNIQMTGKYRQEELSDLIRKHRINIIFIPSLCSETFSYTTEEAKLLQLPVVVFNVGAQAERLVIYEKGLIIEISDKDKSLDKIISFFYKTKAN